MTLDNFVDPARAPRSDRVHRLMQLLLPALGQGWTWDDTHMEGVRIRNDEITLKLEDLGHDLLGVEAVMPERFIPAPGFTRLFSVGAKAIAHQILNETLPDYQAVTAHTEQHQDDEARWQEETRALLTAIGEALRMPAKIDVGHNPGLNMDVLFQRSVGDSMRICAQPGAGPSTVVYTPTMLDLWPFVEAWRRMAEPLTPQARLTRAIVRVFQAMDSEEHHLALKALLKASGVMWTCATLDCGYANNPDESRCDRCHAPRPVTA